MKKTVKLISIAIVLFIAISFSGSSCRAFRGGKEIITSDGWILGGYLSGEYIRGYCGTETDITLSLEYKGRLIEEIDSNPPYNRFITTVYVKNITIPKNMRYFLLDSFCVNVGAKSSSINEWEKDENGKYITIQLAATLAAIYVEEGNEYLKSYDGVLYGNSGTPDEPRWRVDIYPPAKTGDTYVVPEWVTNIRNFYSENVENIYILSNTLVEISSIIETVGSIENIYVPVAMLEEYQTRYADSAIADFFKPIPDNWVNPMQDI